MMLGVMKKAILGDISYVLKSKNEFIFAGKK